MERIDTEITDEELVTLSVANPEYFGELIDRYESKLHAYMKRISGIPFDDRVDILQEVFLSVYQNLNSFNASKKFSSWIYRITHNKTISWWRKHKSELKDISVESNKEFIETLFNTNEIDEAIETEYAQDIINRALIEMKDQYRQILVLKFWEGKSYEEIADILQCSTGTVGTRVGRAKKQFIKLYKHYDQA